MQTSNFDFWQSLAANVEALLSDISTTGNAGDGAAGPTTGSVVASSESGLLNVRATARQHGEVQAFINLVQNRSLTQVLIEATVVEVNLSDTYQSGVDWNALINNSNVDFSFNQLVTGANLANSPTNILTIDGSDEVTNKIYWRFNRI